MHKHNVTRNASPHARHVQGVQPVERAKAPQAAVLNSNCVAIIIVPGPALGFVETQLNTVFGGHNAYSGVGGWVPGAADNNDRYAPSGHESEAHTRYEVAFIDSATTREILINIARAAGKLRGQEWLHVEFRPIDCVPVDCR
jgi:hypothetical protein